jgi:hypothetical protein
MSKSLLSAKSRSLRQWVRNIFDPAQEPESTLDSTRMLEALLASGCIYGIEMVNIDPSWYRTK